MLVWSWRVLDSSCLSQRLIYIVNFTVYITALIIQLLSSFFCCHIFLLPFLIYLSASFYWFESVLCVLGPRWWSMHISTTSPMTFSSVFPISLIQVRNMGAKYWLPSLLILNQSQIFIHSVWSLHFLSRLFTYIPVSIYLYILILPVYIFQFTLPHLPRIIVIVFYGFLCPSFACPSLSHVFYTWHQECAF